MTIIDMPTPKKDEAASLDQLHPDLKRMLRVQWKEFVHFIEDYQLCKSTSTVNGEDQDYFPNAA